ncbi:MULTISPECIES: hypothetical protein [Corallococcus]|uniref:hypothetical protein n=1 Tax=Corallococcus TaxID=83461 RepID=UPI00117D106E|nr:MULTISPECIES: hypothetical protein [Corallococcus]NBD09220.1 hypothetical protein [Corallococcus silvisoli]TSC31243.1 hypothetical protein FOF48_11140 [Corallococcus sp. Z5C101001]
MKTSRLAVLSGAFLAMTLGACGGENPAPPGAEPEGDRFELRLKGVDAEQYQKVMLGVGQVEVTANGRPVTVRLAPAGRTMDLTSKDQAYLLGYFYLPHEATTAQVRVLFDDVGAYQATDSAGLIRARSAAIQFTSKRLDLEKRKRVVVQLHLKDSLFQSNGSKVLLPSTFIVH